MHPPSSPHPGPDRLAASLRRCAFLLNSARLVIQDHQARETAREAVQEAMSILADHEAGRGPREAVATGARP